MKITFVSNYFTHHQSELSKEFAERNNVSYHFIETQKMENERKEMGWEMSDIPPYVISSKYFEGNRDVCQCLIDDSDVVVLGSAPLELVKMRLKKGQLVFFYSERIYKNKYEPYKFPIRFVRFFLRYGKYKNAYMLCASAFTAADYAKTFTFLNKTYKWGYFPTVKRYKDFQSMIAAKKPASILWVARLIKWKHPEVSILVAERLKKSGYKFTLNLIGNGVMEQQVIEMIKAKGLEDCVNMLGAMKPEEVRSYMEQSDIFLFTSDRNEGWGAVLNEAMNSGCAVVASHAIGAVPFLLQDGINGLIYKDGDIEDLYKKTKWLLENANERKLIAQNAYQTIISEWNAENATKRFISLVNEILKGNTHPKVAESGVCSEAEILKDDWYINGKN